MKNNIRAKMYVKSIIAGFTACSLIAITAFAASESGKLGGRGDYSFTCDSGNVFSKYVSATSSASYNGSTSGNYIYKNGRARVDVTLSDGTNNTNIDDFQGTEYSGKAEVKVYGQNTGSAYCYARVSGVFLNSNNKYTDTNDIEASTLYP